MTILFKDSQFRPWNKLVGVSGDLADGLVAILSLLAIHYRIFRVPICLFYNLVQKAREEFPEINVSRQELFREVENALQLGVRISPDFHHFEVPQHIAYKNIGRLKKRVSPFFLERAGQIAAFFATLGNLIENDMPNPDSLNVNLRQVAQRGAFACVSALADNQRRHAGLAQGLGPEHIIANPRASRKIGTDITE